MPTDRNVFGPELVIDGPAAKDDGRFLDRTKDVETIVRRGSEGEPCA